MFSGQKGIVEEEEGEGKASAGKQLHWEVSAPPPPPPPPPTAAVELYIILLSSTDGI